MSYIVIARKWRPQSFDDVIGQEHITTTLKNAIKQDRVAHAYLFCGPRGIGKTTTARILAKALNCKEGPTPNPCNKCALCKEITDGSSLDIIEIDGASNRGIDEIRNLKENVKFAPAAGKFKVYIIDEVHMLTPEAFNALLKTLEEPPSHVKFIFATTAPYKVPATILSRCQRFNFRRLLSHDIVKKLETICKQEKIKIDEQALFSMVRAAGGSMRDAESLLDQVATYCKNNISADDVNKILGSVEQQKISEFAANIIDKDASSAIRLINKVIDEGTDANQFLSGLIEYFRAAMLIKESKGLIQLTEFSKEEIDEIAKRTERIAREDILYILYNLINTNSVIRKSFSVKIPLELVAIKLSNKESIVSLDEIMKRLSTLEKNSSGTSAVNSPQRLKSVGVESAQPTGENKQDNQGPVRTDEDKNPADDGPDASLYRIREIMPQLIKNIKQEKIYIASCLSEGKIVSFRNNVLTLGFTKSNSFHKESLEKPQNKKLIEAHISKIAESSIIMEFVIIKDGNDSSGNPQRESADNRNPIKKAISDPIIKTALDIFDGNIMKFM